MMLIVMMVMMMIAEATMHFIFDPNNNPSSWALAPFYRLQNGGYKGEVTCPASKWKRLNSNQRLLGCQKRMGSLRNLRRQSIPDHWRFEGGGVTQQDWKTVGSQSSNALLDQVNRDSATMERLLGCLLETGPRRVVNKWQLFSPVLVLVHLIIILTPGSSAGSQVHSASSFRQVSSLPIEHVLRYPTSTLGLWLYYSFLHNCISVHWWLPTSTGVWVLIHRFSVY